MKNLKMRRLRGAGLAIAALAIATTGTLGTNVPAASAASECGGSKSHVYVDYGIFNAKAFPRGGFVATSEVLEVKTNFTTVGTPTARYQVSLQQWFPNGDNTGGRWVTVQSSTDNGPLYRADGPKTTTFGRNFVEFSRYRVLITNFGHFPYISGRTIFGDIRYRCTN